MKRGRSSVKRDNGVKNTIFPPLFPVFFFYLPPPIHLHSHLLLSFPFPLRPTPTLLGDVASVRQFVLPAVEPLQSLNFSSTAAELSEEKKKKNPKKNKKIKKCANIFSAQFRFSQFHPHPLVSLYQSIRRVIVNIDRG